MLINTNSKKTQIAYHKIVAENLSDAHNFH